MIKNIQKITILVAVILFAYMCYQAFSYNKPRHWVKYNEPKTAAYTTLDQDEQILDELDRQARFSTYKPVIKDYYVKPSIFQRIVR